jgi:hypothetical protein
MKKQLFIILSIFLLAANTNAANGYNNALNLTFGLQSSVYSNNGILDYSPELARIGIELVHMGHEKFLTNSATQNGITALSWIVPMIRGAIWISTGARIVLGTMAAKEGGKELIKTGTQFSKHSVERLAQRGVTQDMVELVISKGRKFYDPLNKSINYILPNGFASGKSLLVGTNPLTGEVTTVLRSSKNLIKPRMIPIP